MKFLIILFLLFLGYRVFIPKSSGLDLDQRDQIQDSDEAEFADYEEVD